MGEDNRVRGGRAGGCQWKIRTFKNVHLSEREAEDLDIKEEHRETRL